MISTVKEEIDFYIKNFLSLIPGKSGVFLRFHFYRRRLLYTGKKISILTGCLIQGECNIIVKDFVGIGTNNQLLAGNKRGEAGIIIGEKTTTNSNVIVNADIGGRIIIGENVLIGPNAVLRATNHRFEKWDLPIRKQGHKSAQIKIGDDVWIGSNVTILPDVIVEKGAVIGAGAVVTKNVSAYAIAAGVPASEIGTRKD